MPFPGRSQSPQTVAKEKAGPGASLIRDRGFRESSFHHQDVELSKIDPEGFGRKSEAEKRAIVQWGIDNTEPESDLGMGFGKGVAQHYAGWAHSMSNLFSLLPEDMPVGQVSPRGRPPLEGVSPIATAGEVSASWRDISDEAATSGELPDDATAAEKMASIAGTVPGSLVEAGAWIAGAGKLLSAVGLPARMVARFAPGAGLASLNTLATTDRDWDEMAKAGGAGAFIGSLFPISQHMSRPMRALILGSATYATSPEDMDPTLRGGGGVTMAILAGIAARRPIDPWVAKTRIPILSKDYYRLGMAKRKMAIEETLQQGVEQDSLEVEGQRQLRIRGYRGQGAEVGGPPTELSRLSPKERAGYESEIEVKRERVNSKEIEAEALREELELPIKERTEKLTKKKIDGKIKVLERDSKKLRTEISDTQFRIEEGIRGKGYRDVERISVSEKTPEAILRGQDVVVDLARALEIPEGKTRAGELAVNDLVAADRAATRLGEALAEDSAIAESMGAKSGKEIDPSMPPWERELRELSPDVNDAQKGFAEFFRHYLTGSKKGMGREERSVPYETDTTFLEQVAPNALGRFEEGVRQLPAKQQKALASAREEMSSWYEAGGLEAIRGVTHKEQHPLMKIIETPELMREYAIDGLEGIARVDRAAGRNPSEGAWMHASLTRGIPSVARSIVNQGFPTLVPHKNGGVMVKFQGDSIFKLLDPIYRQGKKVVEDWNVYAQGRAAKELLGQTIGKEGIRPSTRVERLLGETREKLIDQRMIRASERVATKEFKRAYDDLIQFNERVLDFAEATGALDPASRANFKRAQYAFGLNRDMTNARRGMSATSDHLSAELGIHKTHGSKRLLLDNFQNLISGHSRTISGSLHNMKLRQIADIAMSGKNASTFLTKIKPQSKFMKINTERVREAYEREVARLAETDVASAGRVMEWIGNQPKDIDRINMFLGLSKPYSSDIMTVLRDGKPEYYRIHDAMLERAIHDLHRPAQREVHKFVNTLKGLKQGFIVVSPDFMVANFVRDTLMSSIMTRTGHQNISSALNGLMNVTFNMKGYKDFVSNMGGGSTVRGGVEMAEAEMTRYSQLRRPKTMLVASAKSAVPALRTIGNAMENAARVGESIRAQKPHTARTKKKGFTREAPMDKAAFMGREISVDFARRGRGRLPATEGVKGALTFMNASVPFFSSMISSSDRMYRSVVRDPSAKLNTAVKMGMVSMLSVGLQEANQQMAERWGHLKNEDGSTKMWYDELEPWEKAGYWNFWVPDDFDPDTGEPRNFHSGRVPKLWEVGLIGTIAEMIFAKREDGLDSDILKEASQAVAHNFNLNIVGDAFPFPLPVGLDLIWEQTSERIAFTGQEMLSAKDKGFGPKHKFLQDTPDTPLALQTMAYATRMLPDVPGISTIKSPKKAEAALRTITARWGEDFLNAGEALLHGVNTSLATMGYEMMDPELFASHDMETLDEKPVIRRFKSASGKHNVYVSQHYEGLREFREAHNAWMEIMRRGEEGYNKGRLEEFQDDPEEFAKAMLHPGLKRASSAIGVIQDQIYAIKRGLVEQDSTPEEKDRMIRELKAERNALMKKINDDFAKAQKNVEKSRGRP